jgi:FKBP-type peptidyl-prolyl cis-trans isomerase
MRVPFVAVLTVLLAAAAGCTDKPNPGQPTTGAPFSQTDLVVGSGTQAFAGNRITVAYSGWLYDSARPEGKGSFVDAGPSYSFVLGSGTVIRGWDQGVPGMRVGGTRRLIIPPELAYGSAGSLPRVPPNATLIFDITLNSIP